MAMTLHAQAIVPVDPIIAAISPHAYAWAVFQIAEEGAASEAAGDELTKALTILLSTPCTTREGAQALRRHLRWCVVEEAENGSPDDCLWLVANARLADLAILMCDDPTLGEAPTVAPLGAVVGWVIHRLGHPERGYRVSNVIPFPSLWRPLAGRRKRREPTHAQERFREVTRERLKAILARVLHILDSLDHEPPSPA